MDTSQQYQSITPEVLQEALDEYDDAVSPRLIKLDEARYKSLPEQLSFRRDEEGDVCLSLEEVTNLVEWKLAHGTFRPSLKKLVSQNTDEFVREVTRRAFSEKPDENNIKTLVAELCKLRGIGPATASLLLSVSSPDSVPFFSDELFRWVFWEDKRQAGWDRSIKYSPKEYLDLFSRIGELQKRFQVEYKASCRAVDVEKAAYVLALRAKGGPKNEKGDAGRISPGHGQKRSREDSESEAKKKVTRNQADMSKHSKAQAPKEKRLTRSTRAQGGRGP